LVFEGWELKNWPDLDNEKIRFTYYLVNPYVKSSVLPQYCVV